MDWWAGWSGRGAGLGAGLTLCAATALAEAERPVESTADAAATAIAESVRRGSERFAAADYRAAEAEFRHALALATDDAERGALEFNLASCAYELGRYGVAEAGFLRSAALDPATADLARVNAGLAALRAGRRDAAAAHLAVVRTGDAEVDALRAELARQLAREESAAAGRERANQIREGAAALAAGEYGRARSLLEAALAAAAQATAQELANLHYGLAAAALGLQDLPAARAHIDQALALTPSDPELLAKRAQIAFTAGEREAAARDCERALELGLTGDQARWAKSLLDDLDPLPATGPQGSLYVGGGYDSNPAQSGIADATGIGGGGEQGSATLSAYGSLGYTGRLGTRAAGRIEYSPSWFVLGAPAVRELSLQGHAGAARLFFAPNRRTLYRLSATSAYFVSGLDRLSPFVWENGGGARVDLRSSRVARTRFELLAHAVHGFAGQEALGGAREELAAEELLDFEAVAVTAGVRLRAVQAGTVERVLSAAELPACGAVCEGATYEIPLSYVASLATTDLLWSLGARLSLGVLAGVEGRWYLDESGIRLAGVGARQLRRESAKRRRDLRVRAGAHAELALDRRARFALSSDYGLLVSRSNVAYDASDPEHALDYGDRRFVQHQIEGGMALRF